MKQFMSDYYYLYLQGNDTVTQLSTTGLINEIIQNLEERAKWLVDDASKQSWAKKYLNQSYEYLQLNDLALTALLTGMFGKNVDRTYLPEPTSSLIIEFYKTQGTPSDKFDRNNY